MRDADTSRPRVGVRRWAGRRLVDMFMLLLLIASLLKMADIPRFEDAVLTWPLVPHWATFPVALAVANLELAIALGWFLRLFPRTAFSAAAVGLVVSIAVFLTYIGSTEAPDCGCFGVLTAYYSRIDTAERVVLRNVGFLSLLLAGGILGYGRTTPPPPSRGHLSDSHRNDGFTILELLVTIALITVIISLLSPLLGEGRKTAQRAVSLSNLRQHTGVFSVYSNDHEGRFPYFVYRDAQAVVRCGGVAITIDHWFSYSRWNLALANGYYDGDCNNDSFYPPNYPRGLGENAVRAGISPYYYGCAFIARPAYWNPATRTGPSQWGSTRQAGVLFPAYKGLLFAYYPLFIEIRPGLERISRLRLPIGFVDGHAESVAFGRIRSGYERGDGRFGGGSHHFSDGPGGLHTLDGVQGRDIE